HELGRLRRGVAEHDPLVACALRARIGLVYGLRDLPRLLVQPYLHFDGVRVEALVDARVADVPDGLAGHRLDLARIQRRAAPHLARDARVTLGDQHLARDARLGIPGEIRIQDAVADAIRDLVRVTFRDRLTREDEHRRHSAS